jgi:hypothetical protein
MNALQRDALRALASQRDQLAESYPNHWVALSSHGEVRAALRFDVLLAEYPINPERVVFAFIAVGAWA